MEQRGTRHEGLASLRGMAAFLIFLTHLPKLYLPKQGIESLSFMSGFWGVIMFFLMMGYFSVDAREKRNAVQYLLNRFMRLYPVYWFLVTINFFLQRAIHTDYVFTIKDWLINLTLLNEFFGVDYILAPSWMLPVEIAYACVFALVGTRVLKTRISLFGHFFCSDTAAISLLSVMACVSGVVRCRMGIALPTTFLLLFTAGVLGASIKLHQGGGMDTCHYIRNRHADFGTAVLPREESVIYDSLYFGDHVVFVG